MGKKEEKSHGRGFVTCNIPLYMCPKCRSPRQRGGKAVSRMSVAGVQNVGVGDCVKGKLCPKWFYAVRCGRLNFIIPMGPIGPIWPMKTMSRICRGLSKMRCRCVQNGGAALLVPRLRERKVMKTAMQNGCLPRMRDAGQVSKMRCRCVQNA